MNREYLELLLQISKVEELYETEYDGRMYNYCRFCNTSDENQLKHTLDCPYIKLQGYKKALTMRLKEKTSPIFKTVGVKYARSSIIYTFMTDEEYKVGDKAVVFTSGNWSIVTIVKLHERQQLTESYNYKWLVQRVDRTNYDKHIQEDGEGYPSVGDRL